MALISCKECGNQISSQAIACPKCGVGGPKGKIWPWIVGVPLAIFLLMFFYGSTIPEHESRALLARSACEKIVGPFQVQECERIYDKAISEGKARAKAGAEQKDNEDAKKEFHGTSRNY